MQLSLIHLLTLWFSGDSKEEIEKDVIKVAEHNGFTLGKPIDFTYQDKDVYWNGTEPDYTFISFANRYL